MRKSLDADATTAQRALRLYQKLLLDGRRHYQSDLAEYLACSPQTVMRLIAEIEGLVGASLISGLDRHKRWYQIRSISRNRLGLEFEELRYLAICRDLAAPCLSDEVRERVDQSIFNFSLLMADQDYAERGKVQKKHMGHCFKGWIDYNPYFGFLEKLVSAADEDRVCIVNYKSPTNDRNKIHRLSLSQNLRHRRQERPQQRQLLPGDRIFQAARYALRRRYAFENLLPRVPFFRKWAF